MAVTKVPIGNFEKVAKERHEKEYVEKRYHGMLLHQKHTAALMYTSPGGKTTIAIWTFRAEPSSIHLWKSFEKILPSESAVSRLSPANHSDSGLHAQV